MMLTGKAKEDFLKFLDDNYHVSEYYNLREQLLINSLIIQFFDNMEHKGKRMYSDFFSFYWKHKIPSQSFNDICIQTIEMCNLFYNELEPHQLPC
jgi:hypothetical protein